MLKNREKRMIPDLVPLAFQEEISEAACVLSRSPLGLQAELTAGGGDVVALFPPQGDGDAGLVEDVGELGQPGRGRPLPGQALDRVVGDEVHVRVQVEGDVAQALRLVERSR